MYTRTYSAVLKEGLPHISESELQKLANELYKTSLVAVNVYRFDRIDKIPLSDNQKIIAFADYTVSTVVCYLAVKPLEAK